MVECGLRCFTILDGRARRVLMPHASVGEGIEGGGGPVRAHRSGAEPVHLGFLAFKVGVFGLGVNIVVHIEMGILWIED